MRMRIKNRCIYLINFPQELTCRKNQNLGSQFEKMCMNDLTDTQLLSKKNDKQHLFTSESTVTWDAVKTMNREVNGKAVARSCFVIMAVLLLISEAVLVTANSIVGYLLIALAVLIPLLLWLRVRYGGRSAYEKSISRGLTNVIKLK